MRELKYHEDGVVKRQITEEEISFLKNLQKEMNTQDNVGQADPRYWVIRDYQKIYGEKLNSPDGICIYDSDACFTVFEGNLEAEYEEETVTEILGILKENNYDIGDLENCEMVSYDDLEEELNNLNISILQYEEYPSDDGMFLSHRAAVEHLTGNSHHYSAKAHTYAKTAWRSSEQMLWKILHEVDFENK